MSKNEEKEIEELLITNDKLLKHFASRTYIKNYEFEDIMQELRMEFVNAYLTYDETKSVKFTTYVVSTFKNWRRERIQSQNYKKRSKKYEANFSLDDLISESNEITYLEVVKSNEITPDVVQNIEEFNEIFIYYVSKNRYSHILLPILRDNIPQTVVAKNLNISYQRVNDIYNNFISRVKKIFEEDIENLRRKL